MNDKKKIILLVSIIVAIVALIIGGTYAYWNWSTNTTQQTAVTFTVTPEFTCSADGGGNITSSTKKLAPTDCMDSEYAIQRTITTSSTVTGDKVVSMDLWLDVNNVSANLLASDNFKYGITKNKNSCTSGVINDGVIGDDISNNKINLFEGAEYSTLNDTYYLYIWLDEEEDDPTLMNQSFDFSLNGECSDSGIKKTTMVSLNTLNTTNYFKEADYKTKITEIHFVYDKDLPNGVIENQVEGKEPYQLSTDVNKPIYGYLNKIGDTDTYKLYITSPYKIYAGILSSAFNGMSALTNITFDNLDTSGTTDMHYMFYNCGSLISLDLSKFNTSMVIDMGRMFQNCRGLTNLNVTSFNTSNVQDMGGMFESCTNIPLLDVSSFDTGSALSMRGMFCNCLQLVSLDLSGFSTSRVTNMNQMFSGDKKLQRIYVSDLWNTVAVTNSAYMFGSCSLLPNYNSSVTDKTNAHYGEGGYLTYKAHN